MANIFVVDDHPLVRDWLSTLIEQQPGLKVCGSAATVAQARAGIESTQPDVAIVDISLPDGSGIDLMRFLKTAYPKLAIVSLSMHNERLYAERALRAGARGYVMKSENARNIVAAIRHVLAGSVYLSAAMTENFADRFGSSKLPGGLSPLERLSDRELEVFQYLGQGRETREIAKAMNISMKTVQAFCARIKDKLQLANAHELLREAVVWNENRDRATEQAA
ncbi:MAG: response regulator transcription factor [Rhizomicrobium sp.]|jgi:DNA-binding NarL/FixJ family response regulator